MTKTALITGASSGIGRGIAHKFGEEGWEVTLVARRKENLENVANEVEEAGGKVHIFATDLAVEGNPDKAVKYAIEKMGKIGTLVNNAGMSPLYPSLSDVSETLFDKVVSVNLKGPFRLMANVGERMMEGDGGAIINISSMASVNKSPTSEPYGAAKAGLNGLTRSFAAAYGPKVRVNCIMAGPFLTDIADAWDMEAFNERARTSIPMQRGGQPDEVVAAALYFAGDGAGFTTGAILAIDGGAH